MSEKIYPKGVIIFKPEKGAPLFVKGRMVLSVDEFNEWANTQGQHMSDYKGKRQLKFNILEGKNDDGLYLELDTYKPQGAVTDLPNDDMPF